MGYVYVVVALDATMVGVFVHIAAARAASAAHDIPCLIHTELLLDAEM